MKKIKNKDKDVKYPTLSKDVEEKIEIDTVNLILKALKQIINSSTEFSQNCKKNIINNHKNLIFNTNNNENFEFKWENIPTVVKVSLVAFIINNDIDLYNNSFKIYKLLKIKLFQDLIDCKFIEYGNTFKEISYYSTNKLFFKNMSDLVSSLNPKCDGITKILFLINLNENNKNYIKIAINKIKKSFNKFNKGMLEFGIYFYSDKLYAIYEYQKVNNISTLKNTINKFQNELTFNKNNGLKLEDLYEILENNNYNDAVKTNLFIITNNNINDEEIENLNDEEIENINDEKIENINDEDIKDKENKLLDIKDKEIDEKSMKEEEKIDEKAIKEDKEIDEKSMKEEEKIDEKTIKEDKEKIDEMEEEDKEIDEKSMKEEEEKIDENTMKEDKEIDEKSMKEEEEKIDEKTMEEDKEIDEKSMKEGEKIDEKSMKEDKEKIDEKSMKEGEKIDEKSMKEDKEKIDEKSMKENKEVSEKINENLIEEEKKKLNEETKSKETKPKETKPKETKPVDTKPEETKPEETNPEEIKSKETKSEETKTENTKSVETKPVETKPIEIKPVDTKTEETKPIDTKPVDTKTEETKPVDTKTEETKPVDTKTEEAKPEDAKPIDTKPIDTKTEETKPVDTKTEENNSKDTRPIQELTKNDIKKLNDEFSDIRILKVNTQKLKSNSIYNEKNLKILSKIKGKGFNINGLYINKDKNKIKNNIKEFYKEENLMEIDGNDKEISSLLIKECNPINNIKIFAKEQTIPVINKVSEVVKINYDLKKVDKFVVEIKIEKYDLDTTKDLKGNIYIMSGISNPDCYFNIYNKKIEINKSYKFIINSYQFKKIWDEKKESANEKCKSFKMDDLKKRKYKYIPNVKRNSKFIKILKKYKIYKKYNYYKKLTFEKYNKLFSIFKNDYISSNKHNQNNINTDNEIYELFNKINQELFIKFKSNQNIKAIINIRPCIKDKCTSNIQDKMIYDKENKMIFKDKNSSNIQTKMINDGEDTMKFNDKNSNDIKTKMVNNKEDKMKSNDKNSNDVQTNIFEKIPYINKIKVSYSIERTFLTTGYIFKK